MNAAKMGQQNQMVVIPGGDPVHRSMILADDLHEMNVSDVEEELGYPPIYHSPWVQRATEQGSSMLSWVRKLTRGRYEDWLYLTLLGCLMGLYSFSIDVAVQAVQQFRMTSFLSTSDMTSRVTIWFTMTAGFAVMAALFIARFIPSATGSGFPEIKAYLQGVKMENTFSPLTCIGKLVFLPITLCTLLPLGKEGPVTHVAAIFALFITKVFKDVSVEEMERHSGNELVAAACTMGAAVCYGAPIGGVLFSIEATRSYFAVRNYWRGFFAAVCGTLFYKALSQVYHGIDILPMFPVIYNISLPCDGEFILISVSVGLVCGLLGPLFVWTHSKLLWMFSTLNSLSPPCSLGSRSDSDSSDLKKPSLGSCFSGMFGGRGGGTTSSGGLTVFRVVHTVVVCVLISALMLPWLDGFSPVMSHVPTRTQLTDLLANVSWSSASPVPSTSGCIDGGASGVNLTNCSPPSVNADDRSSQILSNWTNGFRLDFRIVLVMYILYFFFGTMLCTTLTLPSGTLVPLLRVGFALGRLVGETYCGLLPGKCIINPIIPGCLASMFGAALCASVTHALSISVIVFEMTGQITHIMAVLIAVMVANALSRHLQPSFYDSLIRAKKITVLPKMSLSNISGGYSNVAAQDIMATQFTYLSNNVTLSHVRQLVSKISLSKVIPLVNDNMEPLGLVHVRRLRRLLREEIGHLAWQRDKAKYYVTVNAFRALDLQQLLDAKAVDRLDLEISSAAFAEQPPSSDASEDSDASSAPSSNSPPSSDRTSPATASQNRATTGSAVAGGGDSFVNTSKKTSKTSASALALPSVRVDAYCTVHQNDPQQLQTRLKAVRRKSIISRGGVPPLRSALDRQQLKRLDTVREQRSPTRGPGEVPSTAASNSPNVAGFTTSTPHNRRSGGVRPRFTIRRVKEDCLSVPEDGSSHRSSSQSSLPSQGLTSDGGVESRDDRSSNQQSASPLNSASSVDSSQGRSTRDGTAITSAGHDSVDVLWPLGSSRAIDIRPDQSRPKNSRQNVETSGVRDYMELPSNRAPSEVYDSLVSQSSHTNRVREGLALILPSRRKTMDLAERASNRQVRSQFSFSDMHDKSKVGSSTNLNSIIQKTLDKTSGLFTAIRSPPKESLTEEWRLRRAWRRDRLRRVLDIRDVIDVDPFPLAVNVDTSLVQLHKLFAMLAANKLYVLDRRKLVGCLPLLRFSDFITRGRVEDDTTSVSAGETSVSVGRTPVRSVEEFGSQDTLDDVDDGVYDTITERPSTLQPDMIV